MAFHARAAVIRLAGGDPHVEGGRDARAARQIVVRQRLFQPVQVVLLQAPADADRGRLVPALVDVSQQGRVAAQRLAHDPHALDVFLGIGPAHAHLHRAVAGRAEGLGLLQQPLHTRVEPQTARGVGRHAGAIAAQQAEQRQVGGTRGEIPAGGVERRERHQ